MISLSTLKNYNYNALEALKDCPVHYIIYLDYLNLDLNFEVPINHKVFRPEKISIYNRFVSMVCRKNNTGKKLKNLNFFLKALSKIELKTKKNPFKIFLISVLNSIPIIEGRRKKYGSINLIQETVVSPLRGISLSLRNMAKGIYNNKKIKPALDKYVEEILNSYEKNNKSFSYSEKLKMELQGIRATL